MLVWLNASLKSTETRDELSTTLYLQSKRQIKVMSRCLLAIDALSLPTSLHQEQAVKTKIFSVIMIQQK